MALRLLHLPCTILLVLHLLLPLHGASKGHHILLMGDSLTRYQYMALVYFLEYGKWPGAPGKLDPSWYGNFPDPETCLPSWPRYLVAGNALFEDEQCDCYRVHHWAGNITETRWYRNAAANIRVTFIIWFGDLPVHGHLLQSDGKLPCAVGHCEPPFDWVLTMPAFLRYMVASLEPTHVFVNNGWWATANFGNNEYWRSWCHATAPLQRKGMAFHWMGSTPDVAGNAPPGTTPPHALSACGWKFLDRLKLAKTVVDNNGGPANLFTDNNHFRGPVYSAFNMELLAMARFDWQRHRGRTFRPEPLQIDANASCTGGAKKA